MSLKEFIRHRINPPSFYKISINYYKKHTLDYSSLKDKPSSYSFKVISIKKS